MDRTVIGLDVGTSSSKGVLVGLDGTILASAVREHDVSRPFPGHVEMDAATWWTELVAIVHELLASTDPASVAAIGVSGMGPCVLVTDEAGVPVRPAILYGVDSRATAQIAALEADLGREAIVARGNAALSSQAVGPKLAWIADEEPEVAARARRLFGPSSWLAFRLTGRYLQDHHNASQSWPLYDPQLEAWYAPWVARICPWLDLPPLAWPADVAGTLTLAAAAETGLPAGIHVTLGTVDAWMEAVSVGADRVGDLMLMYGTTMFLIATVAEPIRSPSMWGTVGAWPGTRNLAGGMATSGAITAWLRDLFALDGYGELMALAEASGPGANGLVMLPYFAGERTPLQDPDARGLIAGLTLSHTRGDLARAALEATAFGVRHNVETMVEAGARIERIVAVGGGAQSALWTQIVSDVTGLAQVIPTKTIGASLGAAFFAARTVADVSIDAWNPPADVRVPDPDRRALYDAAYADYRALYPATRDVAHRLAARQRALVTASEPEAVAAGGGG